MADQELDEFLGVKAQPEWRRRVKLGVIILAVIILALLLVRCFGSSGEAEYATVKAERGRLVTTVSATGELAPTNQVTVGSQLSGLIDTVLVDVNDRVRVNQPLAEIDPEQIEDEIRQNQAELAANQAQVQEAKATLAEAEAQFARLEEVHKLSDGRVPSKTELQTGRADLERAKAGLKVAEANVLASKAALGQSQTQRSRAIIRSPVSGVVLAREVEPGQTVAASYSTPTLFVIAEDLGKMKLEVAIDEADVGQVKDGQEATFTVDAFPGRTFPAKITRVEIGSNQTVENSESSSTSTSSSSDVVSYAADLSVDNSDLELRPGMTATADIVTADKKNALLIPNAALRFSPKTQSTSGGDEGGITGALSLGPRRRSNGERSATIDRGTVQTIYVKGDDGKPRAIQVTTGNTNGTQTEVVSGELEEGMEVITAQLSTSSGGE